MTATQITPRPSVATRNELVCSPLIAMAARGFDKACLLQMQDAAFRYAAQSLQNNKLSTSGTSGTSAALLSIVDQHLGGSGSDQSDFTPDHIAAYMGAKALLTQLPQRDAMFDLSVLSAPELGTGTDALPRTRWMARTLVALQRDADRLTLTTPMFASEISALVRQVVSDRNAPATLLPAMRAVLGRADTTHTPDEQSVEDARPTFC